MLKRARMDTERTIMRVDSARCFLAKGSQPRKVRTKGNAYHRRPLPGERRRPNAPSRKGVVRVLPGFEPYPVARGLPKTRALYRKRGRRHTTRPQSQESGIASL